ncbi:3-methyladenine DNA glycosylase 2 [Stutzerimonas decontaminans]|jgi:DNA-3-methyladenine glycosylase II|uniref:DNA-3-methyladenine glycosylase II n=2 Tax=Stutzerimonas TaxID=2901164 RepID=A0ABX4W363_9GAMM|nr:AlkA N-terminal domain-containing protein [Stutzerimonas decontaminans]AHY42630.1 DNA-3-methyladenine glycosidase [Stutzerimonas decontaminans]MCQ4246449.1 3-methyladenine DNA glycosylase 2 [Stutzerimonas decontaminans]PNF86898.1 3-methyladenine DNA glycosylase 2 [Stutzerimonas decontaminans]
MSETILLPYLEPWDWQQFQRHFALRLLPGVERLDPGGYARTLRLGDASGWLSVNAADDRPVLELMLSDSLRRATQPLVAKVRKMFDLDADPQAIAAHFVSDPALGPLVAAQPGLRLLAAYDPFEQAVRAVVGQQVTVKAAVTITRRIVERLGEPLPQAPAGLEMLFPTAQAIADDQLENIGMPAKRAQALRRLAAAVAEGALHLHVEDGADTLVRRLCELPGIGPWTAEYIALRGFGVADAFPAADLGLLKAPLWGPDGISAKALADRAEAWRPWRAYAAIHIWDDYSQGAKETKGG